MTYREANALYVLSIALANPKRLTFKHFLKVADATDRTGSFRKYEAALKEAYTNRAGKTAKEICSGILAQCLETVEA